MPLTDKEIQALQPTSKPYKKYDAHGLYLEVKPTGSKLWRFKYIFNKKHCLLALGQYPQITLKQAREKRDLARLKISDGIDPAFEKQQRKLAQSREKAALENTFGKIAKEWFSVNQPIWSEKYAQNAWGRIERTLLPWLGNTPINEIDAPLLLEQLRRIERRGHHEIAHRAAQLASAVFRYAIAAGKATRDPSADLRGALQKNPVRNLPAVTEPEDVRKLLLAIDGYEGSHIVFSALQMSALTFLRPGELRNGTWNEVDWHEKLWKIPTDRMKMRKEHLVPLADQALKILEDLRPLTEETPGNYIFPSERMNGRPMSENTINTALRTLGYPKDVMCAHGFRTTASTRLHESGLFESRIIEVQLAHTDKNTIRSIYNRALYLKERTKMMQWYADYLDTLRAGGKVIPFRQNTG